MPNQNDRNNPMMNQPMNNGPMNNGPMVNRPMNDYQGYRAPENRFERKNKYTGETHRPTHVNTSMMYGQKQGGTLEFSAVPNHGLDPNSRPLGDQTMVISNASPNPYMQQQMPQQRVTTTIVPTTTVTTPVSTTTSITTTDGTALITEKHSNQQIITIEQQRPRQRPSTGAIIGGIIGIFIALGLIVIGVLLIVGIITF